MIRYEQRCHPKEAAAHYGVKISTLRKWDNAGTLERTRTPGNQRRFCIDDTGPKN
ncbi:MAG: MerR family DNA-binding transcriptional regulator [Chroococcales cyanobacterium]